MPNNARPELSGFYYPNKFARMYLEAIEAVLGGEELAQILDLAGIPQLIKHRPPDNLQLQFDFSHLTALHIAFEERLGESQGRATARAVGRAVFAAGLRNFGDLTGVTQPAFQKLPLHDKLTLALPAMAHVMMQFSDQISQAYPFDQETFRYTLERCPMCWMRYTDTPACQAGQGLLEEGLRWLSGGKTFRVEIEACVAAGDEMGRYIIYKEPIE